MAPVTCKHPPSLKQALLWQIANMYSNEQCLFVPQALAQLSSNTLPDLSTVTGLPEFSSVKTVADVQSKPLQPCCCIHAGVIQDL